MPDRLPSLPNGRPDEHPDERLDAWLDGALPPDDARAVAERVAADPVWADAADAARLLRRTLADAPLPTAPDGFRARVLAALPDSAVPASVLPPVSAPGAPAAPARAAALRSAARLPAPPPRRRRLARAGASLLATLALLVVGVYTTRPAPEPTYSAEDVARARAEAEWTLAYLNRLNVQTAAQVADALPPLPRPSTR